MTSSNKNIDWNKVIKKEAIGVDGLDLGKVHDVRDTYIITQRGFIDKKRYHIPKSSAESFDRDILRLRISESDLQGYEEQKIKNLKATPRLNHQICQKNKKPQFQ